MQYTKYDVRSKKFVEYKSSLINCTIIGDNEISKNWNWLLSFAITAIAPSKCHEIIVGI